MDKTDIEEMEVDLLLEGIFKRYGYDFRNYARATVFRRIRDFCRQRKLAQVSELIPLVIHNEEVFQALAYHFSIPVTSMFRDPDVYRRIREKLLPVLASYPFIRVWHAGCASGEEVYSLAILLYEADLYSRTQIYATDFNEMALEKAREGIFPIEKVKEYTANYQESGGVNSFSDYYHADYDCIMIKSSLKKNITFANHNLTVDQVFGEMNLILCRNVLIYFNKTLQNRVLQLFDDSLCLGGFLCLGAKENLKFTDAEKSFQVVSNRGKIFKKKLKA